MGKIAEVGWPDRGIAYTHYDSMDTQFSAYQTE